MKNEEVHPSEEKDGDYGEKFRGLDCEKTVRTKTGDDGVEETHVTYTKRRSKTYFIPK